MSLQDIQNLLTQAQEQIAKQIEQSDEGKQAKGEKADYYIFVYDQHFTDTNDWGPNTQHIYAYDVEGAFQIFGHVIKSYGLTIRNINYGLAGTMTEHTKRYHEYWDQQMKKEKE